MEVQKYLNSILIDVHNRSDEFKAEAEKEKAALIAERKKKRLENSGIPKRFRDCTLEEVYKRGVPRHLIENFAVSKGYAQELKEMRRHGSGLIYSGSVGQLKTTLACAVGLHALNSGYSVLFISMPELMDRAMDMLRSGDPVSQRNFMDKLMQRDFLILDDLGMEYKNEWLMNKVDGIITYRYNEQKPIIITTNLLPEDMQKLYKLRIIDRLRNTCTVLTASGSSVRGCGERIEK